MLVTNTAADLYTNISRQHAAPGLYDNAPAREIHARAPSVPARIAAPWCTACCRRPMASHRSESDQGRIDEVRQGSKGVTLAAETWSKPAPVRSWYCSRKGAA